MFQLLRLVVCKDKLLTEMSVFFIYVVLCVVMMLMGEISKKIFPVLDIFVFSLPPAERIFDISIPTQEEILN